MRVKAALLGFLIVISPVVAVGEMNHARQNGTGDECSTLPPELRSVVAAMEIPGRTVEALVKRGEMNPLTPTGQRLEVMLHPSDQVSLVAVRSRKVDGWASTFAGLLELEVPTDGVYRISAGSSTWIDVLERETSVARVRPNHRLHRCGQVHKSIEYPLKKGNTYWLELSGSRAPTISLMITPEE